MSTPTLTAEYIRINYVSAAEIAKHMRADIKAAVKAGALPGTTRNYSVRIENYSMGRSINITAKGLDGMWRDCDGVTPSGACCGYFWCVHNPDSSNTTEAHRVLTAAGRSVEEALKAIHNAYNYNRSDVLTDYFNVNFYGDAEVQRESGH